ncbi:MAG: ABC transporter ATP-binding protein [Tissierellia bacterium]|nr:ABC transporter ATP-binding protein [Tissierellia bacterium]
MSILGSVRKIVSYLGQYKKYIRWSYLVAFLETSMTLVPYALLIYTIRTGLTRDYEMKDFYLTLTIMLISIILRTTFKYTQNIMSQDKGYRAFTEKRLELTDHLAKLNMGYYTDSNIGNVTGVVTTDIIFTEEQVLPQMGNMISAIAGIISAAIFLFIMDSRIGFAYIIMVILALLTLEFLIKNMKKNARIRQDNMASLSQGVLSYVRGIQTIKAFNMGREKNSELESEIEISKKGALNFVKSMHLSMLLFYLFSSLPIAAMVIFVSNLIQQNSLDMGKGIGFIVLSFILYAPLAVLGNTTEIVALGAAAIDRYEEVDDEKEISESNSSFTPQKMDIVFNDVTFAYEDKEALKNINLEIKDKTFTALVGRSGSGKTTIANLIARFWDIEDGEIKIDGVNIKEIKTENLLKNIAMVFQRVYLFNDSIYNNIAFGNKTATKEEVIAASKKARCHDFIMKMENGYDTIVGEGGSNLSGGEKQRISIARAILKDAPLILLDEATAGIDPENEKFIQDAIDELVKDKTLVIIAHRLSTIQKADQIIYLKEGEIVERGTHEELLEYKGEYRRQYEYFLKNKN